MKCPPSKKRLRKAVSCGSQPTADPGRGNGADDEGTGSDSEGGCGQAEVVGSGRDYGRDGPHDAALQTAGLVERRKRPGSHRKRRPGRALPGMMLHIDGSEHRWFGDERYYELIVVLDDATSEIYHAQAMEAEPTRTVMAALRGGGAPRGLFCSLYSDRAGHFF